MGTPLAALTRIVSTGDKQHVFNGVCGAESGSVPVSAVAPAMLFSEMEVQKRAHSHERPPILPPPGFETKTANLQGDPAKQAVKPWKMTRMICGASVAAGLLFTAMFSVGAAHARNSGAPAARIEAHPAANGDALLEALMTELDRSKSQLKMDQVAAPYYIEYRVNDVDDYSAEAAFGAVRENQRVRYRVLRVVVRIGDYKQDSYYGIGMGETNILPLDDDRSRCAIRFGSRPMMHIRKPCRRSRRSRPR